MGRFWRVLIGAALLAALAVVGPVRPATAAGVVGDGTPGSCTEAALDTALTAGGLVTFNCDPGDLPIVVTSEKTIAINTQLDGGGLVTLSGDGTTRIFAVNLGIELDVQNITLTNGQATLGGAIHNAGTLTITNSTLSGNSTGTADIGYGGAIYNDGSLTVTNSTLSGNVAEDGLGFTNDRGGGIFNSFSANLIVTGSTLSGNSTSTGGGISNEGTLSITNSTLSGNVAVNSGGGIMNDSGATTSTNSTLSGNEASSGGGVFNSGALELTATILAASTGGNCTGAAVVSQGHNLSDDGSCALGGTGDLSNANALLGPLQDNGGPTLTHLPGAGSPAIDNAQPCPTNIDQRGIARPEGSTCDIGSVEVRQSSFVLCASYYTGAVTSPRTGNCGAGQVQIEVSNGPSFCINPWTGQLQYSFGRACAPPRIEHTLPDDGDLLTCVSYYTGANRWVRSHSQCTAFEAPNTIPAAP